MKVLIWSQYFWPENFHINAVARSLHEQGVEVTILTGKPNYPEGKIFDGYRVMGIQKEEYAGFEVIRVPLWQRGKNSGKELGLNYLSFIASGYLFAPYALRGRKFDVVFVYAPSPLLQALPAIYVSWLKRAQLVTWVQDIWPDALAATGFIKNRWVLEVVGLAVRYIYSFSDSILIQSEGFRKSVERLSGKREKIHYFPNSAEYEPIGSFISHQGKGIANVIAQGFSIVFAGNIGRAQSCGTIIEAAKLLQNVQNMKFYLIGNGSMVDSIARSIKDYELDNVVMVGQVPAEEMAAIYASASVLLLTLRDDLALSSTIPSKLQSYLAAGKPIVASCNGESATIVTKAEAGFSSPPGDFNALAMTILKLYEMPYEERILIGNNGREYFEKHYSLHKCVAKLKEHFVNILKSRLPDYE